ncbi:MAG: hypothetical protein ABIJ14_00085 [Nanoarchaeota archaeon]
MKWYQKTSNIVLILILLIGMVVYVVYEFYKVFFTNKADWIDTSLVVTFIIFGIIILITIPIEFLSEKYPNSKILKFIKKQWENLSELLEGGLHGL